MYDNYRDASRKDWVPSAITGGMTTEKIQVGCMQRIADASEIMATNYVQLQHDRDMYKRWYNDEKETKYRLQRRIVALQGVITKMKKRR